MDMLDPEPLEQELGHEVARFRWALELEANFAFHVIVAETLDVLHGALAHLGKRLRVLRPRPPNDLSSEASAALILTELDRSIEAAHGEPILVDAMIAHRKPAWALVFQRLNELRNGIELRHHGPLLLAVTPNGETLLGREAPDLWSRRGSGMRLRDASPMHLSEPVSETLPPPTDPAAFESLCFDLFQEIWNDPGAQKYGRAGQPDVRVDIFGRSAGRRIGVRCKHRVPTPIELFQIVAGVRAFGPRLDLFILATSGPRNDRLNERARTLSEDLRLEVQVWSWDDIWPEISRRRELFDRISSRYWPGRRHGTPRLPLDPVEIVRKPRELADALGEAEEAMALADREGDVSRRISALAELATNLHQAGQQAEALARFQEAESLQAEWQPQYPLLASVSGFQFCNLLLAGAERAAGSGKADPIVVEECRAVERRAGDTLEWSELNRAPLLDVALDHLTLGRALLYRAILEGSTAYDAKAEIETAIDGLRHAGHAAYFALGLNTRAWLRSLLGDASGAREDLAEAQDIAERGSMPLLLADIQLQRARLFQNRDALVKARRLIAEHGYGRRREELADLETMAAGWQVPTLG